MSLIIELINALVKLSTLVFIVVFFRIILNRTWIWYQNAC